MIIIVDITGCVISIATISNRLIRRISANIVYTSETVSGSSPGGGKVVVDGGIDNDDESAGTRMCCTPPRLPIGGINRRNAVKNMPVILQTCVVAPSDAYRCSPSDN